MQAACLEGAQAAAPGVFPAHEKAPAPGGAGAAGAKRPAGRRGRRLYMLSITTSVSL